MNGDIKNVVFLIHGVGTKEDNWTDIFATKLKDDPLFKDWAIEQGEWGYVFFAFSVLPFIRYSKIRTVQERLREVQAKYPNAKIHVIAHSYGTMLIHEAVKRSDQDTDKPAIKLGSVILVGGIVSEKEKFNDTIGKGKIEKIFNFCSYQDRVIRWQPIFGKCGYWGFVNDKERTHILKPYPDVPVQNYRFDVHHSEYFTEEPPDFYILWRQLLRLGK